MLRGAYVTRRGESPLDVSRNVAVAWINVTQYTDLLKKLNFEQIFISLYYFLPITQVTFQLTSTLNQITKILRELVL